MPRTKQINKNQLKVMIYMLKALPMLAAVSGILNTALSYWGIDVPELAYISGLSLLPLFFFWFSSYVFRLCEYYRVPLYYIFIDNTIGWIDYFYGIPIDDFSMFVVHAMVAVASLLIFIYLRIKEF